MNTQLAATYTTPVIELHEREAFTSPIVWWVVLLVVLLALAITVAVAVVIWCTSHGGGFVVSWYTHFPYVSIGCSK